METLAKHVADMVHSHIYAKDFSNEYKFENGTMMVVTRSPRTPGYRANVVSVLVYDKAGKQVDERAENWLVPSEVAQKMAILASE